MKHLLTGGIAFAALVGVAALPAGARAMPSSGMTAQHDASSFQTVANRRAPYRNVNRGNDAGNDTGDAATDQLNQQSLQRAQTGQNSPMPGPDSAAATNDSQMNDMDQPRAARGRHMRRAPHRQPR